MPNPKNWSVATAKSLSLTYGKPEVSTKLTQTNYVSLEKEFNGEYDSFKYCENMLLPRFSD